MDDLLCIRRDGQGQVGSQRKLAATGNQHLGSRQIGGWTKDAAPTSKNNNEKRISCVKESVGKSA